MRRMIVVAACLAAAVFGSATPTFAAAPPAWLPAPSAPWSFAAGQRCDFAVTGTPVVDEVRKLLLRSEPRSELYVGDLVVRVTNSETGQHVDADAGGQAVIVYDADGGQSWYAHGPLLIGFATNGGTLPRGLYIIDGLYRLRISPNGIKTLTIATARIDNLCDRLS